MHGDIPTFNRCCFCMPLRHGLIFWGYLKLIILGILAIPQGYYVAASVYMAAYQSDNGSMILKNILLFVVVFLINVSQMLMTIGFIVGGYRKNVTLLKIYYINSMIVWAILTTVIAVMLGLELCEVARKYDSGFDYIQYRTWYLILSLSLGLIFIIMEAYLLLLIRSEIAKLRSGCQFRFTNNIPEAQCILYLRTNNNALIADADKNYYNVDEPSLNGRYTA